MKISLTVFLLLFFCSTLSAFSAQEESVFSFENSGEKTLLLKEGGQPVLAYVYDVITNKSVSEQEGNRRTRGCYIHPLYGLRGEILTDDFPVDHYHHHGVFWAWPHVKIGEKEYDLWTDNTELEQRFVAWKKVEVNSVCATLSVENGWFVGDENLMKEEVTLRVFPKVSDSRSIDVELSFTPLKDSITLRGAEEKSYGGLTIRFKPKSESGKTFVKITVPDGLTKEDLSETPLPWADLSSIFDGRETESGAALFIPKSHPDYPPTWLTRHYGPLCIGWPGVLDRTFEAGKTFSISYRIWVHENAVDLDRLTNEYNRYLKESPTPTDGKK